MTRKTRTTTSSPDVSVIASTQNKRVESVTDNSVPVESRLLSGLRFDVPNGNGGKKSITIPGVNDSLRGKKHGILALPGNAVLCRVAASDWSYIKSTYAGSRFFTSAPPLLRELPNDAAFRSKTMKDERKEAQTRIDPIDPTKMRVTPAEAR